ncbi:hypothetical protein VTN00DRAFT_10424 [Thermoascus crustaceus]|uniref:uncharacterized protein n=1 Tax=Thermoascus crustaceus TaxID=5088 RepID=UPI003741F964
MSLLSVSAARYVRQGREAAIVKPEPRGADQRPENSVGLNIANSGQRKDRAEGNKKRERCSRGFERFVHKGAVGAAGERNRKCAACIGAAEEKLGAPSHTQVAGACLETPDIDSGACGGGCFSVSLFRRTLETAVYRLS